MVFVVVEIVIDRVGKQAPEGEAVRLKGQVAVLGQGRLHGLGALLRVIQVGDGDLFGGFPDLDGRALDHDGDRLVRLPLLAVDEDADIVNDELVYGLDEVRAVILNQLVLRERDRLDLRLGALGEGSRDLDDGAVARGGGDGSVAARDA